MNVLIFYYFDFSPLFEYFISIAIYVISTATLKFHFNSLHSHPGSHTFYTSSQVSLIFTLIPGNWISIPLLAFLPLFSIFLSPVYHFDFYR